MKCKDAQGLATRFVDGELDDARASALRGHLRGCDACRAGIEDEALLRDAGADLPPVDPPPELWQGIQQRLAAAEVADAGRSRAWLLWQRLRPHALTAAVAAAAAAVLAVWWVRRDAGDAAEVAVITPPTVPVPVEPPGPRPAPPARTFEEVRADELGRADATYDGVIADLRRIVAEERAHWPAGAARRFDTRMAALEAEAGTHRRAVAGGGGPAVRDPLYANLRAQIALMERAAMGDLP
ncbi:MAG TPA: zf-HC2 domain-containing protein [Kofleriaceae bacterium]|nr:zf-HC2 domain-containing protein [Kofleriaceae bacterium]